ncbi:MAG: putative metal-dependent hydrolase [Eubacterium sp.]|nr:putative metal-dependent hydrolase [Eubacterium sp.]
MKNHGKSNDRVCSIILGGRELKYTLKRTNRRSIGISIDKTGFVTVAGPNGISEETVRELLREKASWILDKLSHFEALAARKGKAKEFAGDEEYPYLGKMFKLKIEIETSLKRPVFRLQENTLELYTKNTENTGMLKDYLKLWYVEQFKRIIEQRVGYFSKIMGVTPGKITVREQKTRWGSCSSRGNLNFNWKLIMARPEVLDYVVIHELCHMKEMNHSDRFWALVKELCPRYKEYRKWLKDNGSSLSID